MGGGGGGMFKFRFMCTMADHEAGRIESSHPRNLGSGLMFLEGIYSYDGLEEVKVLLNYHQANRGCVQAAQTLWLVYF